MDQNNSQTISKLDDWHYWYAGAYLYALDHPDDPDRWRFCEALLPKRKLIAVEVPEYAAA